MHKLVQRNTGVLSSVINQTGISSALVSKNVFNKPLQSQYNITLRTMSSNLPSTMEAQVLTKLHAKDFEIQQETLKMPKPGNGEVLIKVRACGVCHTDLHVMKDEVKFPIPAVMGHEISGTIVSIGPNQDPVKSATMKVGQRVISPFIMPCGGCYYCVRGREDICETFFSHNRLNGTLYDGTTRLFTHKDNRPIAMYSMAGLAEYCVVPSTAVFELPDSINFSDASIIGCAIFTAYGAVRHGADLRAGETIAVVGAGGVGANVLQFARAFGASKVIAIDINDDKLRSMTSLGATHTINSLKDNVTDRIKEITKGRGVDVCIEALGRKDTFIQAVNAVADGGRAVMVGIAPAGVTADVEITRIVRRSIRIIGSYGAKARQDIPAILQMIQKGLIDVSSPISKRYKFNDAAQAYHDLNAGKITGRGIVEMEQ